MNDRHVHLYGCVGPALALELAAGHAVDWGWLAGRWTEAGLAVPDFPGLCARHRAGDPDAARRLGDALHTGKPGFAAFQARYDLVVACSRWAGDAHQHWSAGIDDELARVWDGLGPGEYRVLIPASATPAWVAAALDALGRHCRRAPGRTVAISVPRSAQLRHWPQISAARQAGCPITGIDLCGVEDEPAGHAPLAAAVATWNSEHPGLPLDLLVHVGEQLGGIQPASAVRRVHDALALGASRLGHALAVRLDPADWPAAPAWERVDERRLQLAWELRHAGRLGLDPAALASESSSLDGLDPDRQIAPRHADHGRLRAMQDLALEDIRGTGVAVEVCPTSNRVVSGLPVIRHGIGRLAAAGVSWVVGSDDPGVLGTDLAAELAAAGP